jgi:hypothetical protein
VVSEVNVGGFSTGCVDEEWDVLASGVADFLMNFPVLSLGGSLDFFFIEGLPRSNQGN